MDLRQTPAVESGQKVSFSITSALVSAVHEWLLIFMLFIDAIFSYLVTRFARHCQLQIPCLLCSRLDHVLGKERPGFYWDLLCHNHKSKISSLVLCRLHNNLVDVHGTCESCFFSFATINKSNAETYRLLVGKLGAEPHYGLTQGTLPSECNLASSGTRNCYCCNERWVSRTSAPNLFRVKSIDSENAELDIPRNVSSKCSGDELLEFVEGSHQLHHWGISDADPLPHVEYAKVKVTSDTESEASISDNKTASILIHEIETSEDSAAAISVLPEPQIVTLAVCPASEKLIHPDPPIKFALSQSSDTTNSCCNEKSEAPLGHGFEELSCQQTDNKNYVTQPSDLISFAEALPSPTVIGTRCDDKETDATSTADLRKEVTVKCREASDLGNNSTGPTQFWKEVTPECEGTSRVRNDSIPENEIQMDPKSSTTETNLQVADSLDLGDAYRLAVGTRGRQLSGKLLEQQISMKESTRASEDLKLLLSQISAARGIELSLNDSSPRVHANSEEYTSLDASSSMGVQILQRRISLERNESSLSLDGSTVSEIEGESVVDRLKRQVEHDKKIMSTLYKELEEERNASAVAANQAMAMITRLQEEKAFVHMEALQCLRMMEEQAEYDGEAFQNVNDLLVEKEKQIQDLEAELEQCKNMIGDLTASNNLSGSGEKKAQKSEESNEESNTAILHHSDYDEPDIFNRVEGTPEVFLDKDTNNGRISMQQFANEKQYVLKCLKKLEEKLYIFSKMEVHPDMNNGDFTQEGLHGSVSEELWRISQENGGTGKNSEHENEGRDKFRTGQHINRGAELDALRYELSVMSNRLEALEAEKGFIECYINSLEKGDEGFEFIKEIVFRLQELHSAQARTRNEI